MDADAGRVRTALRLQAVAARVHHMDCAGFAEEVCDAVDVAGRLGYLGCLHAVVRLAAAREAMQDADGMTCGELGCGSWRSAAMRRTSACRTPSS